LKREFEIFLRDRNPKMAMAWRNEFENCDVKISCGDIFDITADAIVSPANSFGFMDGGIDLLYSERFGWDIQKKLQKILISDFYGELPVGQALIIEINREDYRFLISAPTMRVPNNVSNTVNAYLAFRAALIAVIEYNKCHEHPIKSLVCPGLGTSVGQMPYNMCAFQMRRAYDILLYDKDFPKSLMDCQLENIDMLEGI
jgi:O-acetyl-ADP-ribose deacetylase (regulator of RNase III)